MLGTWEALGREMVGSGSVALCKQKPLELTKIQMYSKVCRSPEGGASSLGLGDDTLSKLREKRKRKRSTLMISDLSRSKIFNNKSMY